MNYWNLITITVCIVILFCFRKTLLCLCDFKWPLKWIMENIATGKQQQILSIIQSHYYSNCQNNHQLSKYRTIYYCCNNDDNTQLLIWKLCKYCSNYKIYWWGLEIAVGYTYFLSEYPILKLTLSKLI